ncbi:MAG: M81 family metallopeptidase [Planctomycetota bacterium]|nr:M81 family metallopeptidase [Planctomycetota bacterium]
MSHRVLLAGLFHETHTFLEGETTLADFQCRRGAELLTAAGDGSPLAGILDIATERGWTVLPAIDLRASPGPIMADEVVEEYCRSVDEIVKRELPAGLDGVCLVLHGAGASRGFPDVEFEVIRRLRGVIGPDIPIGGVLDLHGNISREFAEATQAFVAYRQNPHADACEAARDGARVLDRLMASGERAKTVWAQPAVMWPPTGTGTAFEPMLTLEREARTIERTVPGVLAVNVFAGFSFADTRETGVSFTAVVVGDTTPAVQSLQRLCDIAWTLREAGNVREESLAAVLDRIQAGDLPAGSRSAGPIVLAEPSDNIGGGAPGDGTILLGALVDRGFQNAVVAIDDPLAVRALETIAIGGRTRLVLGGRGSSLSGGAIHLEVELLSRGPGRFQLEDPHSHLASMCGDSFDMGPCAVVRAVGRVPATGAGPATVAAQRPSSAGQPGIRVLITSYKTPPFDLAQWRSQGIVPEEVDVIAVKAAVAHRKVYDPIARAHFTVETPGPCTSNLASLPWKRVRRPVFPLDTAHPGE